MDLKNNENDNKPLEEDMQLSNDASLDEFTESDDTIETIATNNENSEELQGEELQLNNNAFTDSITFKDALQSQLIDVLITASISILGTIVIDFILRIFKFYISDKFLFIVILFIPALILYNVLMTTMKNKMTLGQKLSNIRLTKNKN
ncbi:MULTISPECIES: RDD family protein [Clostridium]|uniref:hypothetical protein n=1 Tax=Clostridium TaxID=1485 RepID=UPI0007837916|nr:MULTISPECIES: hypothetical protein [Clostridium]MBU5227198.1 RDD family protein [Clostridium senegalense]